MTTEEPSPEKWRAMHSAAETALVVLRQRSPEETVLVEHAYRETKRRLDTLTQKSLFDGMVFDLYRLMALTGHSLVAFNAGPGADAVRIAADTKKLELIEAEDKKDRRVSLRENWKLILSSGGIGMAVVTGIFGILYALLGQGAP